MKIIVAVDQKPYSAHAVDEVAKLAANTWANVTLLGVQAKMPSKNESPAGLSSGFTLDDPLPSALQGYRERFLRHFEGEECPYIQREFGYELIELRKGIWEELYVSKSARKDLRTRIRIGNLVKEILAESREEQSDLIVMGCDRAKGCAWEGGTSLPQKVVGDATCSVLVVKEEKEVKRIVCCLDHDKVSQQSLEMINQLVTLYKAGLEIVGLTEGEALRGKVEKKMGAILRYYTARRIKPLIEVVEVSALGTFISQEAQWGLMALWMGKKSILEKVFPRGKVNRLVKESESSVLILR